MAGSGERVKRCEHCGRLGSRMAPINNRWIKRIDGWRCHDVAACNERVRRLGQWIGIHKIRRRDLDGTEWTIYRSAAGTWCLRMQYREHSMLTTGLLSIDAAKAHAEDMIASLAAHSLRDYAGSQ